MTKLIKNKKLLVGLFVSVSFFWIFSNLFIKNNKKQTIHQSNYKNPEVYYEDIILNKITLKDDPAVYSVKNGNVFKNEQVINSDKLKNKILGIALFYQWMREDPLLVSATANIDNIRQSIYLLKKEEEEYKNKFNNSSPHYPIEFLENFLQASTKYHLFLDSPGEQNADSLLSIMRRTQKNYYKNINELIDAIQILKKQENSEAKIIYLSGETYTSLEIIENDFQLMLKNSDKIKEEINFRERCLKGELQFCQRPLLQKMDFASESNNNNVSLIDFLPPEMTNVNLQNYSGPYLINSPCWADDEDRNYIYHSIMCRSDLDYCYDSSALATNTYFVRVGDIYPYDLFIAKKGPEVIPQKGTAPYVCNNLEYQPSLTTVSDYYQNFKNNKFYNKLPQQIMQSEFGKELNKYENNFFNKTYPSEDVLNNLSIVYAKNYTSLVYNNNFSDIKNELLYRYLKIKEKMSNLDLWINRIAFHFYHFSSINIEASESRSDLYVYATRSNYSLLFLNFSPNVWRIKEKPKYLKKISKKDKESFSKEALYIIDYKTAIQEYGKDNLLLWRNISNIYDRHKFIINQ